MILFLQIVLCTPKQTEWLNHTNFCLKRLLVFSSAAGSYWSWARDFHSFRLWNSLSQPNKLESYWLNLHSYSGARPWFCVKRAPLRPSSLTSDPCKKSRILFVIFAIIYLESLFQCIYCTNYTQKQGKTEMINICFYLYYSIFNILWLHMIFIVFIS